MDKKPHNSRYIILALVCFVVGCGAGMGSFTKIGMVIFLIGFLVIAYAMAKGDLKLFG